MDLKTQLAALLPFSLEFIVKDKLQQFRNLVGLSISSMVENNSIARKLADVSSNSVYEKGDIGPLMVLTHPQGAPRAVEEVDQDSILIPPFTLGSTVSWPIEVSTGGRADVVEQQLVQTASDIIDQETEGLFRLIVCTATTNLVEGGEQIARVFPRKKSFGKELVLEMCKEMKRLGDKKMTHVLVDSETYKSLTDEFGNVNTIVVQDGDQTWTVTPVEIPALGVGGGFNINGAASELGIFKQTEEGHFFTYQAKYPNVLSVQRDENGQPTEITLSKKGEFQVYGLSLETKAFSFSVINPLRFWDDPIMTRNRQHGFYGFEEVSMFCKDPSSVVMGIVEPASKRGRPKKNKAEATS